MATIDVEPKKKSGSRWPWALRGLGLVALLIFLNRNHDNDRNEATAVNDTVRETNTTAHSAAATNWNDVDFNTPAASYEEITDKNISVRGNDRYAIYGLDETILFDTDKSTLRPQAEADLKQVLNSINRRYNEGELRIYGYTDAQGNASHNKELAEQRAAAVKDWLLKNGVTDNRISLHPIGEAQPASSNSTAQGRQLNRRVEIVARRSGDNGNQ